ncbi:MAG: hypothetical protein WKF59_26770 [Chitinophagaceae bacterium]
MRGLLQATISFHANTKSSGVEGSRIRATDGSVIEFNISCLTVTGNQAVMTGVITSSTHAYLLGQQVYIRVVDNGEGANANADQIAVIFGNYDLPCGEAHGALSPISGGNIQVNRNTFIFSNFICFNSTPVK